MQHHGRIEVTWQMWDINEIKKHKYTLKIPKAKDNVWQALPCQRTSFSANWIWTNLGFHSTSYPNGSANPFACGQAQDCHEMFHSSSFCNTWAPLGPTQPKERWGPLTRPSVCLFSESMLSQKKPGNNNGHVKHRETMLGSREHLLAVQAHPQTHLLLRLPVHFPHPKEARGLRRCCHCRVPWHHFSNQWFESYSCWCRPNHKPNMMLYKVLRNKIIK